MPVLHQFDYLFAIGTIFACLDGYALGANDVSNSFASSVASKSITLRQACLAAAVCEFLGAVLVGARVSSTIKNGIISIDAFQDNPGVQLLGFTCALVASSSWVTFATYKSWTVSSSYSIISAIAGVGVAIGGKDAVQWGWNGGKGLSTIFSGFIIAPSIAAIFSAIIYMLTKFFVFMRENPTRAGLIASPIYFFLVTAVLTMSIVFNGAPSLNLDKLSDAQIITAIFATAAVVMVLSILFWLPYVYAQIIKQDYTLRWYHFFQGPLLWRRPAPEDAGVIEAVPDYRIDVRDFSANPAIASQHDSSAISSRIDEEKAITESRPALDPISESEKEEAKQQSNADTPELPNDQAKAAPTAEDDKKPEIQGPWILPKNLWILFRHHLIPRVVKLLTHGTSVDVHQLQKDGDSKDSQRIRDMHLRARQYDNSTEHVYSFLQVMTACTASFAHGASDVAVCVGPYSAIYHVWSTGTIAGKTAEVPLWILVLGGAMIVIGLSTYGYNIMRVLGNRLTMYSPSRGFSMELGSACTIILASQLAIPVSTTMCITGSTIGVAMCNGDIKSYNWRALARIVTGWILTVPVAGTLAGCLMAFILYAPHFS